MALIHCPECNTQVSSQAEKCPKCAYPITANVKSPVSSVSNAKNETNVVVKSSEGCFLQTLNTGCMAIAIIIAIIVLMVLILQ